MKFFKSNHRPLLLVFFILLCNLYAHSQGQIEGVVKSIDGQRLESTTVALKEAKTNELITYSVTNNKGSFIMKNIPLGNYVLNINRLGFESYKIKDLIIADESRTIELGIIQLEENTQELEEILITSEKRTININEGNIVVDLSDNAGASTTTVLEQIQKLPGVSINRQSGDLQINGSQGAIILVNGVQTYMPSEVLMQVLSNTNSQQVSTIEIMSNPPASLDAEGNSGVINIVMKKTKNQGLYGNVTGHYGYGKGNLYGYDLNVSYKREKINFILGYNHYFNSQEQLSFNERVNNNENFREFESLSTRSFRDPQQSNHNINFGLRLKLSERTNLGLNYEWFNNVWNMTANSISQIIYKQNQPEENNNFSTFILEENRWTHNGGSIFLNHKFLDSSKLKLNVSILDYQNENPSKYDFNLTDDKLYIEKNTPISIFVSSADYNFDITEKINIETGSKLSISNFENKVTTTNTTTSETNFLDNSNLKEKILGVYLQTNYAISENLNLKSGIRFEYSDFDLVYTNNVDDISRINNQFFPSFSLTYKPKQNRISIFYNRRINRPSYNDIAPFVLVLDNFTRFQGNPRIQPSLSNTLGFNFNYQNYFLTGGYSVEKNTLAKFQITVDNDNVQVIQPLNLGKKTTYRLGLITPLFTKSWLEVNNSFNAFYTNQEKGSQASLKSKEQLSYTNSLNCQVDLSENTSMEFSGFYNSRALSGLSLIDNYGGLDISLKKQWDQLKLVMSVNDVFNSIQSTAIVNNFGRIENGYDFSHRTLKIAVSYSFGQEWAREDAQEIQLEEKKRVE